MKTTVCLHWWLSVAAAVACTAKPAQQPGTTVEQAPASAAGATAEPPTHQEVTPEPVDLAQEERAAYERAKPVFVAYCAACHTGRGKRSSRNALEHFSMDSYPFGGHHASEITATTREVLGQSGSKPTMPKDRPGSVQGEELKHVLAWADAFDRAHGERTDEHDEHGEHEHGEHH